MVEWSRAFGDAPIHIHEAERPWVMRPDPCVRYWKGENQTLLGRPAAGPHRRPLRGLPGPALARRRRRPRRPDGRRPAADLHGPEAGQLHVELPQLHPAQCPDHPARDGVPRTARIRPDLRRVLRPRQGDRSPRAGKTSCAGPPNAISKRSMVEKFKTPTLSRRIRDTRSMTGFQAPILSCSGIPDSRHPFCHARGFQDSRHPLCDAQRACIHEEDWGIPDTHIATRTACLHSRRRLGVLNPREHGFQTPTLRRAQRACIHAERVDVLNHCQNPAECYRRQGFDGPHDDAQDSRHPHCERASRACIHEEDSVS